MTRIKMHISKVKLPFYPPCEVKCGLQNRLSTLFGPRHSYLVHIAPFCPLWFYQVYIGPIRSNLSTWSNLVDIGPICSYSVHIGLLCSIQFTLVLFGPPCSHSVIFFSFGPLCSIWSICIHFVHFCTLSYRKKHVQVDCTYSKSKFIIYVCVCVYLKLIISKILSIALIVATLLLSHINIAFQSTLV